MDWVKKNFEMKTLNDFTDSVNVIRNRTRPVMFPTSGSVK